MRHELIERNGTSVIIPISENYHDVDVLIQSDYFRLEGHIVPVWRIFVRTLFWSGSSGYLFWFRIAQYRGGLLWPLAQVLRKRYMVRYGIQVPITVKVGYGLLLQHSFGTIIHTDAIIGNNVTLHQFVNIGSTKSRAALLGDCVYVNPMTCIVNDVTIGNNVTIGAGAVVNKDIPENATAVGVPAKVINFDNPAKFIGHKWIVPEI